MFIVLIRTIVLYLLIIVGIRLLGKRQVGELEPSELVLALIIADLASVPMQDNGIPLSAGVIPDVYKRQVRLAVVNLSKGRRGIFSTQSVSYTHLSAKSL